MKDILRPLLCRRACVCDAAHVRADYCAKSEGGGGGKGGSIRLRICVEREREREAQREVTKPMLGRAL